MHISLNEVEINIKSNPAKSFSLRLSGKTPTGTRDSMFKISNQPIRNIRDGEFDKFLGMPVGIQITRDLKEPAWLMETADKILQSNLAPWQRLDARLSHENRKDTKIPQEVSNDYIFGPVKTRCAGIPEAAADSDI
ncbi:hypothetical protein L798_07343 [Zootermopsis nevadensis]|uniref:Uncharacterized protein n=1 Tax=Zootermopsis nevadensis TaxID=136037 RepID=A0A067QH50_ZOONE|nr:hypothetical protein L798_07343 [Zootermopsis nevadensis]